MDNNEAWRNRNQNAMERNDAFEQVAKLEELRDQLTAICNKQTRRITELETQLAESQERERMAIDLLNQIACRCNYELQDRSGQHVARVPGSRQWRDALYSIRLQIESMQPSQASAEGDK